jgi:hypothetical protein
MGSLSRGTHTTFDIAVRPGKTHLEFIVKQNFFAAEATFSGAWGK